MKTINCIICPRGCLLHIDENNNVSGNSCPRGKEYAIQELTHPIRTLTSSIRVKNRKHTLVSVKTSVPIPKEKMMDLMEFINKLKVDAPTNIGDVVAHNPLGIEVDILISKKID